MRVTVGMIVGAYAAGQNAEEILALYPYLEKEDLQRALEYAESQMMSDDQEEELDRRLDRFDRNGSAGDRWESLYSKLLKLSAGDRPKR